MKKATAIISQQQQGHTVGGKETNTVLPPLYTGSTVLLDSYQELLLAERGEYPGIVYGTDRMPPQRAFEAAISSLEGSALTRAFQSGISAINQTLLAFTSSGDHILVCDNVYGPTARFCRQVLAKYQVEVEFIPPDAGAEIRDYLRDNTRLIFLESPGSNTFEIQDIPAITAIARHKGVITILDNTWATPLYCDPFALGVDISIHSATKYIGGHSDILLGTVSVSEPYGEAFATFYQLMETFASPQDCALALRGLKTLPLRLSRHSQSALEVGQWLCRHPLVERVLHPALDSHPQHHLWQRDFSGASGLFAFLCTEEYGEGLTADFINSLDLFGIGYSWGGFKSLITAGRCQRSHSSPYQGRTLFRLNIGLEDPEDLIADLKKAFRILG
ncbi:cystathionine beta-lyase [Desulfogranum mediterraneum]|uniref:cystathionine beta-lyase n=1 Tax=Desulfogranum mediterraneum TaxID=160661 RepID=UPI00048F1766|nr:cystathionine beta-lyase [Desulfogranum mediterraneum]